MRKAGRPFGGCFPARNAPFSWRSFAFENALTLRGQPWYVALTVLIGSPLASCDALFGAMRRPPRPSWGRARFTGAREVRWGFGVGVGAGVAGTGVGLGGGDPHPMR